MKYPLVPKMTCQNTSIKRQRPCWTMKHVEVLVAKGRDYTFPTNHAMASGAAAGLWIVARYVQHVVRRVAQLGTVLALAITVGASAPSSFRARRLAP